jgi:hypothetical protein
VARCYLLIVLIACFNLKVSAVDDFVIGISRLVKQSPHDDIYVAAQVEQVLRVMMECIVHLLFDNKDTD